MSHAFAIVSRAKCFAKIISVSEKNKSHKHNWPPVYIVNIFELYLYETCTYVEKCNKLMMDLDFDP